MHTAEQVGEWLRSMPTVLDVGEVELSAGLEALCHKGLMVSENGRYLSLALPANPNW
jgi:hypothetical protein